MSARILRLALLLILLLATAWLLAACGTPPIATPPPTPQPVFLAYPPELRPYADTLAACARQYPDIALYLEEAVVILAPDQQTSLFLVADSPPAALTAWNATLLASDSLVVIVNRQNALGSLSASELRAIWSGKLVTWASLADNAGEIQVWTYPAGSKLRSIFDSAVMAGELTSSQAWLAPDPQAVLEAVSANPNAIGYLPASWLDKAAPKLADAVQRLRLPVELDENLHQQVLALTEVEPQGALRTLLLCFQADQ